MNKQQKQMCAIYGDGFMAENTDCYWFTVFRPENVHL